MNEISYLREDKPGMVQTVISQYLQDWPRSPIMEHRHQPALIKIVQLHIPQLQQYWNSSVLPDLIPSRASFCFNHTRVYCIPCTYWNIAYIDINCKNNRQMPAAWKVWRIGVKIPFVFALPAPSQCPHTLCIYSPQLSCPASNRKTEELEQGLTVGQLFCFSN